MTRKAIYSLYALCAILLCALAFPLSVFAKGEWKLHPTFDTGVLKAIDTPGHFYFLALGQIYDPSSDSQYGESYPQLFDYDKQSGELRPLNSLNILNGVIAKDMYYNRDKGYLLVIFDDSNIDFLYEDGTVRNVPGLKSAHLNAPKTINDVAFDSAADKVYLAGDFGLLVLDDKKYEVAQSKLFPESLKAVGVMGDKLLMATSDKAYFTTKSNRIPGFDGMTPITGAETISGFFPLQGDLLGMIALHTGDNGSKTRYIHTAHLGNDGSLSGLTSKYYGVYKSVSGLSDGYYFSLPSACLRLNMDGSVDYISTPDGYADAPSATSDFKEFWFVKGREGYHSRRYDADTKSWTVTRSPSLPDAPNVFKVQFMVPTDTHGMLLVNHGSNRLFYDFSHRYPNLLSSYKDGRWTSLGIPYRNPSYSSVHTYPRGLAQDPKDPDHIFFASQIDGLLRLSLSDPNDIKYMTKPSGEKKNCPGFIKLVEQHNNFVTFVAPKFDSQGNMWTFCSYPPEEGTPVWIWPTEARLKLDTGGIIKIPVEGAGANSHGDIYPGKTASNRNIVFIVPGNVGDPLLMLDHKGTLSDYSDDTLVTISTIYDQDGSLVPKRIIYDVYEDPSTGLFWVANADGVFTVNPQTIKTNPSSVRRIKVSRNDGTNLADYLLAGVVVHDITQDEKGNKWFATRNAGVVQTTSDGTRILNQFTMDNSDIPSDLVYAVEYNPFNNSMMMSTDKGLAEYFISGTDGGGTQENSDKVKIYPNPVRPDYYGWINIEGVQDNALVKIVDSAGNLVRELGRAEGGSARWDGTDLSLGRVRSGVYYVLVSGDGGEANVGKVLVVN